MTTGSPGREDGVGRKVAELLRSLEKLPPHRGVTYRGLTAGASFGRREGQVVVTHLLTASLRDIRVATENLATAGLVVLLGRTGRAIDTMARRPEEQEVVFLTASMFMVVKRAQVDGIPVAVVEQLNPELGRPDDVLATLDEITALVTRRVAEARVADPVDVASPGKFAGDIE